MPMLSAAKNLAVQYENKLEEIFIDHTKNVNTFHTPLPPLQSIFLSAMGEDFKRTQTESTDMERSLQRR